MDGVAIAASQTLEKVAGSVHANEEYGKNYTGYCDTSDWLEGSALSQWSHY